VQMKRHVFVAAITAGLAFVCMGRPAAKPEDPMVPKWSSYHDVNSGVIAELPRNIFAIEAGSPSIGKGRQYATADGRALVVLSACRTRGLKKTGSYLSRMGVPKNAKLSYSRVTHRFFAISGRFADRTFYNRCNFSALSRDVRCVHLEYPSAEKKGVG
ncbi:MAG: hypothetical protein JOZ30_18680, partial [Hyphomicrobiales bacterium]|nr:hypothetical protein [Hyphomicrobiales bacterium]